MRLKVLITRKIFDEAILMVKQYFEVEDNQSNVSFSPPELIKKHQGNQGAIILFTDRVDEDLLSHRRELKIISDSAVGYNKIDVETCTAVGSW